MSEAEKPNEPHALEVIMAAGPPHVSIWPTLKEADDKSKAIEGRREDWIRLKADLNGERLRFPRAYMTGTKVYHVRPGQLHDSPRPAETEAVIGPASSKGNGSAATVEPKPEPTKEAPAAPAPR